MESLVIIPWKNLCHLYMKNYLSVPLTSALIWPHTQQTYFVDWMVEVRARKIKRPSFLFQWVISISWQWQTLIPLLFGNRIYFLGDQLLSYSQPTSFRWGDRNSGSGGCNAIQIQPQELACLTQSTCLRDGKMMQAVPNSWNFCLSG